MTIVSMPKNPVNVPPTKESFFLRQFCNISFILNHCFLLLHLNGVSEPQLSFSTIYGMFERVEVWLHVQHQGSQKQNQVPQYLLNSQIDMPITMNDAKIKPSAYRILFFGFFIISCQKCMKTYQCIVALMATPEATHNDS